MNYISYKGRNVLTMAQISSIFNVDANTLSRNFQRNKDKYIEGTHYIVLTGEALKSFKNEYTNLDLKFTSILYLWTTEGMKLLSKSNNSIASWEYLMSIDDEQA